MNIKEFIKLISILLISFLAAFFGGRVFRGHLFVAFDGATFVVSILATFYAAASWAFLSYLDGVLKDITCLKEIENKDRYLDVIEKFGILKSEILHNIILIFVLFICERIASGVFSVMYDSININYQRIPNIIFSFRMACFAVLVFALFCHLKGFVVALEYRNIIARYARK